MIFDRAEAIRRGRRRLDGACFVCGVVVDPPTDSQGRRLWSPLSLDLPVGRFGLPHGVVVTACRDCGTLISRSLEDYRRNHDLDLVRARLRAVRGDGYVGDDLDLWMLPALIWAGRVLAARANG